MPPFQFLASFGGHGFGHVVVESQDGSHVDLVLGDVELVGEVPFSQFRQPKGFGKGREGHLEEAERIDETDAIVFDFQGFAPVTELFDNAVVVLVLMDDKVPIVPLEIMGQHIDLTRVVQREGVQPFEKISETMLAWETKGPIVVFGFGHDQIGFMLFMGLHGFNVKKHVQGWCVLHVVYVHVFLLLRFIGSQGLKPRGRPSFGARTSLTRALAFLFLFTEFLRAECSLNETTVGLSVHVLAAGRTVQVVAPMTLNGLVSHFLFETVRTATSTRANGGLGAGRRFSRMVFGAMSFVTSVPEKGTMALTTKSRGFQTPRVNLNEIGALFLATGPAMAFLFGASMLALRVIGFPTGSTHVTGSEKPWQTGDDIVMAFLVEQDQLFVSARTKRRDVKGTVGVH